ncbi:glyceraldehyde-3-phosphate dehydrogenase 1, partial [Rhizopus stolonifer]
AVAAAAANSHHSNRGKNRTSKRYSVSVFYSMATEQDNEVEDELAQAQRSLRDLKTKISGQSKKNFVLERDVRYLDSRIALLIQNRIALDESEPRHIATLCRLVNLAEIDTLLQTVMFTLYGNQYESREEHLLLTMFQFGSLLRANTPVSRMMTTYTRRGPGQCYLKSVLSERITSLVQDAEINLEINPVKVYDQLMDLPKGVTPEDAAANQEVQEIIQPRLEKLMELAENFLDLILSSVASVPYGIRWICKQIRSLTKRKSPDASEYS